jgi:XapX domain-containing protein
MKIVAAFVMATAIGAFSRWARIPSLAPRAIVGALLIVAMNCGYVAMDRWLADPRHFSTRKTETTLMRSEKQ